MPPTADAQGRYPVVDGVSCDRLEHTEFHIHSQLFIRVRGAIHDIPANIGIHETCLYWLHTHGRGGYLHVEAPRDTQARLGAFFDIWGEPLTDLSVADWAAGAGERVFAFVDGKPYAGDPRTVSLRNRELIELQVGSAPVEPLTFTFP